MDHDPCYSKRSVHGFHLYRTPTMQALLRRHETSLDWTTKVERPPKLDETEVEGMSSKSIMQGYDFHCLLRSCLAYTAVKGPHIEE